MRVYSTQSYLVFLTIFMIQIYDHNIYSFLKECVFLKLFPNSLVLDKNINKNLSTLDIYSKLYF